jgi:GT2 family glycosyltransferase
VTADLAIQIVNYRTREHLARCLQSVTEDLAGSSHAYTIDVLDNASGDDLAFVAERYPQSRIHHSPRNLGFGAGHNLLATITEAPVILLLNPDVEVVTTGAIEFLFEILAADREIGVVGPRLVDQAGKASRWDHGRLSGVRAQISRRAGHSYWRPSDRPLDVAWVSGAAMMTRREHFSAVKGFDERFFLYKEEEDLCLRMRQRGCVIRYEPRVSFFHEGSVVAARGAELSRSERYFISKHFGDSRAQRMFAIAHKLLPRLHL